MQDGFYLSTYLNSAGLNRLVNVAYRHDNNVSLWRKHGRAVTLLGHWELERLTGQKQHRTPFAHLDDARSFLNVLLADFDLTLDDMTEIWGTPGLATVDDYHLVAEHPDLAYHSLGHLYSAMLLDSDVFFDGTVLGMAVDRGPDRLLDRRWKTCWFAGAVARAGSVEFFPIESPGPLYGSAKDRFRLREGTLMALATATDAEGNCDREAILDEFAFSGFESMAQAPAALDRIHEQVRDTAGGDPRFTEEESLISAVMKEVQGISVMIMERNVDRAVDRFALDPGTTHLALAGGYALNCPTNSHLMLKYGFAGLLAPPCVSDGGQSIGMALAAFHKKTGGARFDFTFPGAYLGRADDDVDEALAEFADFIVDVSPAGPEVVVDDILDGPVAWFAGRSETGPRALGNRSLLADPTSPAAKTALNELKRREWWRPVAPVVLEEHLTDWFADSRPSPYMLETFTIRDDRRTRIPAVAHLDQSARVQSVNPAQNPRLYALIAAFHRRTGVPMLCNTSLNDKGEPIVDTIAEAVTFCLRRRVPIAYFNGRRVVFTDFEAFPAPGPRPRTREPFVASPVERSAAVRAEANPHGLPDLHLYLLLRDFELGARFDIRTEQGAAGAFATVEHRLNNEPGLREHAEHAMRRSALQFADFGQEHIFDAGHAAAHR
ncbi:carbamoyltransferase C-terminal domain-containing protein [Amycolatopsis sp. NPDC003731]